MFFFSFLYNQKKNQAAKKAEEDKLAADAVFCCFLACTHSQKKQQQAAQKAEGDELLQEAFAKLASGSKVV